MRGCSTSPSIQTLRVAVTFTTITVDRKGASCRNQLFPQGVHRLGASNLTLHDCRRGKGDRSSSRNVTEESAGQAAVDLGPFIAREACSFSVWYTGDTSRGWLAASYFLFRRASDRWAHADGKVHLEFCLIRNCLTLLRGEIRVAFGNNASADAVQMRFVMLKTDQQEGGVHNHADTPREPRGGGGRCDGRFRSF